MTACPLCGGGDARAVVRKADLNVVACRSCGIAFLDPMPDDTTLAAIYGAHYYGSWNLDGNEQATKRMKVATFMRLIADLDPPLSAGSRVLDVGCATGFFLEAAVAAGYEPFGVDIAHYAVNACEARFGTGRFFCGQLEDAHFPTNPDGNFDAIFMSDYIEHVPDPRAVLAVAARRLTRRGSLVITTPNVAHVSRKVLGGRWPHFKVEHLWYFSPQTIKRLLAETGLQIVAIRPAHKSLSVSYMATQFRQYPMPVATPVIGGLARVLPNRLADALLAIPTGEMTIVAMRP